MNWLVASDRTALDSLGGMTVTLLECGRRLIPDGEPGTVYWITGRLNASIPQHGSYQGLQVYSIDAGTSSGPYGWIGLRTGIRRHFRWLQRTAGVDAAVIHQPVAGEALGHSLLTASIPSCYFFHGPWALEYDYEHGSGGTLKTVGRTARRWIEDRALRAFPNIAVFSRMMADLLHLEHPAVREPVLMTPGIDLVRFHPCPDVEATRRGLDWPADKTILLAVRRLVPRMGLDLLINAFGRLAGDFPDALLFIGGRGPIQADLEALVEERGLADRVRLLGYLPQSALPQAYGAADLVIMPSLALEGLGLVTLESMACGTAVAATPVGGNEELIAPFRKELLAATAESEDLEDLLRELLGAGRDALRLLGEEARRHVAARYGWDRTAADLRTLLTSGR
jgi:glycosyltransferase involved in cell wall biosynthesis